MMKTAWLVSFIRFPLLIISLLLLMILLKLFGLEFQFPFLPEFSTVYFTAVNVLCFILLQHLLKKEGRTIKELIDYRKDRVLKDILFGFLWLIVLYIPFVLTIMGMMLLMYGMDFFHHFQTVFAGDGQLFTRPRWLMWFAACVSICFPFLNAPIEELMYRGYAQPLFFKNSQRTWPGIVIPSVGFALQHIFLAVSLSGAIVYMAAFFVWGIGSGLIFHQQKRLFPLIVCHFLVNIAFSMLPIVFIVSSSFS